MDIDEIIQLGNEVASNCRRIGYANIATITGADYENWLSLATRFVELNYPEDADIIKFRQIAAKSNQDSEHNFQRLMAILKALKTFPPITKEQDITKLLSRIYNNFQKFDNSIKRRYGNKSTIIIDDEHDLQDALRSILKIFVDDVRPEDYVPSYAGSNSRVDFLLPEHKIVIETKMTNSNLKDKEIGEQLIIDCARYKNINDYNHLMCFVYDKDAYISNPTGLIKDLEKISDDNLNVSVFISPQ